VACHSDWTRPALRVQASVSYNAHYGVSLAARDSSVTNLLAGVGVAAGASRVLRKVLFGVSNLDPASYAGAIVVLVGIVGPAALLPARRALQLNLAKILHFE
jgi:hypothetical protein